MIKQFASGTTSFAVRALCLLLASSFSAQAAEIQSLASIKLQAESFIMNFPYESPYPPRVQLGHLDSRLRLKACHAALSIEFSRRDLVYGNTSLLVRCPTQAGWKIHLPVRVDVFDDVIVTAKALHKGQKIDAAAIIFQKHNITRLNRGYYSQIDALQQMQAKRNLKRGTVLTPSGLAPQMMVHSGQRVTLELNYNGLQIKSTGKALHSATLGQLVKVRNTRSMKIVEGIVSGEGMVRIGI